MPRRKSVVFSTIFLAIIFGSALFVGRAFLYDTNIAHPGLTKQAAELYNQNNQTKLTSEQINWLMQGAIEEDTPIRWMNHFYDPVHNIGFKGLYDSAKIWANNYDNQVNFSKGNQSWSEAIYNYKNGNIKDAFLALGHILHLIEDMAVPAHTRDDAHPEGDPYEQWVKSNFQNVSAIPIYYDNLNKYFDYLANYSNNNFLSADTIFKGFVNPNQNKLFEDSGYLYNKIDGMIFKLLLVREDAKSGDKKYYLDRQEILSSYFSLLAPKAVGSGAGVIKLFFEETQKSQNYKRPFWKIAPAGIIQEGLADVSADAEKIYNNASDKFTNLWDSTKAMVLNFSDKQNTINFLSSLWQVDQAVASGLYDLSHSAQATATAVPVQIARETISSALTLTSTTVVPSPTPLPASPAVTTQPAPSTPPPASATPLLAPTTSPASAQSPTPPILPPPTTAPASSNIAPPASNPANTGASSHDPASFGAAQTQPQPQTQTQQQSQSQTQSQSESQTTTTPSEQQTSISTPAQESATSTPESASSTPEIPPDTSTSTPELTTSTPSEPPAPPKVIINEIAWGGTQASSNDEWMELYNDSPTPANIDGWTLTDGGDIKINFSSSTNHTIPGWGFYLLERTNDTTISTITADYIYKGSLKDSGEKLQLKNAQNELMDEVDCLSKWFAGRNEWDRESMERKDPSQSGDDAGNWQSSVRLAWKEKDASGNFISGTPKQNNSAITYLNGTLSQNKTLTVSNSPYFLDNFTVASGTILTINPGVVIIGGKYSNLFVNGEVVAYGTSAQPIIFTSYNDEAYQNQYSFTDKNWGQIRVYPGGALNFNQVKLLNGNSNVDTQKPPALIYAEVADVSLSNTDIAGDKTTDLYLAKFTDTNLKVDNVSWHDTQFGVKVLRGGGLIKNSSFANNRFKALEIQDAENFILENNTFADNGWDYLTTWNQPSPLQSPIIFQGYLPTMKNNTWTHNLLNAPEWLGQLKKSATWDLADESPLMVGNLEIPAGVALEISAGAVLKMPRGAIINVFGALNVLGTESVPVVFTSVNDDTFGGDTNLGAQQDANPEGVEWGGLVFESGENSTINYLTMRYANDVMSPPVAIYINHTPVIFDHLILENSRVPESAILLKNASDVILKNVLIKNHSKPDINSLYSSPAGIFIDGGAPFLDAVTIDTFNFGLILRHEANPTIGPSDIIFNNVDVSIGH